MAVGVEVGVAVGAKDGSLVGVKDGPPEGLSVAIDAATGSYKASKDSVAANPGCIQYVDTEK